MNVLDAPLGNGLPHPVKNSNRARWLALVVQCAGLLMIMLDSTVVTVALPSIKHDLRFTESSLVWVVNSYIVPYAGFLLICGRLGDCYGHRRIFVISVALFTLASLACGIADSQVTLLVARAVQGIAGAAVSAVVLSLVLCEFQEISERAKALSILSSICAGGGSMGVLIGGLLTSQLNWHWIFLVNVPVGLAVCVLSRVSSPDTRHRPGPAQINFWGAVTFTAAVLLTTYEILKAPAAQRYSSETLLVLGSAIVLFALFVRNEARTKDPLVPLAIIQDRNMSVSLIAGMLWAGAMYTYSFIFPLYLQGILNYDALKVGLTFLPSSIVMAFFSLVLSGNLALRFGAGRAFAIGTGLISIGLLLLVWLPVNARFAVDVLPGTLLLGVGCGIASNPWILGATDNVTQSHYGAASGIVNSAFTLGGAIALSAVAGIASAYTRHALLAEKSIPEALNGGYHLVLCIAGMCAAAASLIGAVCLGPSARHERRVLSGSQ